MKKWIAIFATVALAAAPAPALAADPSAGNSNNQGANAELLGFCYALIDSGQFPSLNLGECMGFNESSWEGFPPHFCDLLRETGAYDDFGFTSYADCVRNLEL